MEEGKILYYYKKIKVKRKKLSKGYFILICIILLFFIFLLFHLKVKFYTKEIFYKSKKSVLFQNNISILLPGKKCPNQNLRTLYLKRISYKNKYDKPNNNYPKITAINDYKPVFFTKSYDFREKKLKALGFNLNNTIDMYGLYLVPYTIDKNFKKKIKNVIVNKYQKINRFLNFNEYVSKSLLYINYKNMKKIFPLDYDFMLETYSYPEDKLEIQQKFKNYEFKISPGHDLWLLKPKSGTFGAHISFLENVTEIKNDYLITKFLTPPHLIRGHKYDLRFHALVTSIRPLKLYFYNEGLVRIASEIYDSEHLKSKYTLLTNLMINIKNKKKFIYPKNLTNMEVSNLWNLETFRNYCERKGINYNSLYEKVVDIFIKMMFSVRKKIIEEIDKYKLHSSNFYHIIGFDIIFDENLKPYLLEANRRCGFRDDNDAEKYYTHNIIADTLNLVGLRLIDKKNNEIYNNDNQYKDNLTELIDDSLCELERPRGGYSLIFPLRDNIQKYKKYYLGDIPKEDEELWNNLSE